MCEKLIEIIMCTYYIKRKYSSLEWRPILRAFEMYEYE